MAEIQNDQTDIEPLDDEALDAVAGGSSGNCCSCHLCSTNPEPVGPAPADDITT